MIVRPDNHLIMEQVHSRSALSKFQREIDVIFSVSYDGQEHTVSNIRLEGNEARRLNLPSSAQLNINNKGESAFYYYNYGKGKYVFYENTLITKKIITAILRKVDEMNEPPQPPTFMFHSVNNDN